MRLNWLQLELLDLFLSWQTQQEQRKLACAMPNAAIYCLSKKDDSYCCLFLFIHRIIFYMCKRHVLPQIAQITQRNTASCIISQRKTGWCLYCFWSFFVIIWEICGRHMGSFLVIGWVSLRVCLPQITLITQTNTASCIISQRKTGWGSFILGKLRKFA